MHGNNKMLLVLSQTLELKKFHKIYKHYRPFRESKEICHEEQMEKTDTAGMGQCLIPFEYE